MAFNFEITEPDGLLNGLASLTGSVVTNERLELPPAFGKGYIRQFQLDPYLTMMIHQYELQEDVRLKRSAFRQDNDWITFSFRNVFNQLKPERTLAQSGSLLPSVQVSSANLSLDFFFPAKTRINTIIITVHVSLLTDLMASRAVSSPLQTIFLGTQPYLYEERISAPIRAVAAELVAPGVPEPLHGFYRRIKAQEMICLFFVDLLKRQNTVSYLVNEADIQLMYRVRDKVIADLSLPPNLTELSRFAGISESKLKRLFRQIFGDSIYQYYQTFRLNEAAYLLKEQKLSVTETGLRLGFTNLSHFSRAFEQHTGQKPKKYSARSGEQPAWADGTNEWGGSSSNQMPGNQPGVAGEVTSEDG